eukprot:1278246-Rhodomonas_salina.2
MGKQTCEPDLAIQLARYQPVVLHVILLSNLVSNTTRTAISLADTTCRTMAAMAPACWTCRGTCIAAEPVSAPDSA